MNKKLFIKQLQFRIENIKGAMKYWNEKDGIDERLQGRVDVLNDLLIEVQNGVYDDDADDRLGNGG